MELLWERQIGGEDVGYHFLWSQMYKRFFLLEGRLYAVHSAYPNVPAGTLEKPKDCIACERFEKDSGDVERYLFYPPSDAMIPHPDSWECEVREGVLLINTARYIPWSSSKRKFFAKVLRITDEGILPVGDSPPPVPKKFPDALEFSFNGLKVFMETPMRMKCVRADSGETVWTLRLTAYLYTEIEEKNGVLFFGTAGKGGRFYGVRLDSGKVLCNIDTGGTTCYAWSDDRVFMKARRGNLMAVDPFGGTVKHLMKRQHKLCDNSPVSICGDRLYTMLTHPKKELVSIAGFALGAESFL